MIWSEKEIWVVQIIWAVTARILHSISDKYSGKGYYWNPENLLLFRICMDTKKLRKESQEIAIQ